MDYIYYVFKCLENGEEDYLSEQEYYEMLEVMNEWVIL